MSERLSQAQHCFAVETSGQGFVDLTRPVRKWLQEIKAGNGLLTVFLRHTSASLVIQENADSDVRDDLLDTLDRLAPERGNYRHTVEGPDDMPAHIKTMLTASSLAIPVIDGAPALGTWQAIYLVEHRARPHRREAVLHFIGSLSV
jgi:secondary thiamine-phosphate synthase enzyme